MSQNQKCFFCETDAEVQVMSAIKETYFVKCPICGRYEVANRFIQPEIKDIVAAYLYHHDKEKRENSDLFFYYLGEESEYKIQFHPQNIPMRFVSIEEIKSFFPTKFSEKVDMSLLAIAKKSVYFGNKFEIADNELFSLLFVHRFDESGVKLPIDDILRQYRSILDYFEKKGYIDSHGYKNSTSIQLLADGWKQIEKLQISDAQNKDVFVSMSFADELKPIREAIREGIITAGFSAEFMDEIVHNKQIVPEMFRLIRECRFLIMDISVPNYGAYYEAGYALGLGKEVIITCKKEARTKELTDAEKPFEKYLRPHFDIAQKQILYWDNYDDLSKKISEWIKALIR